MRELAVYSPKRSRRSISIELEERSKSDLAALLSALETCILANDIRSVRVELDDRPYLMTPT
jgi:hypothetical protein